MWFSLERWPSGRRRTPGKCVYGNVSRVRIPLSPPVSIWVIMFISCPCSSNQEYPQCCGLFLETSNIPQTPEKLMRSRYSAYTLANVDYIQKTMRGKASMNFDAHKAAGWAISVYWLGLEVIKTQANQVEFKASYLEKDSIKTIHEISTFENIDGCWFYTEGEQIREPSIKISKNSSCPCGSGRKFKNCHWE